MKYKELHNGEPVPVIGQGTWRMGGGMQPDISQDEQAVAAIRQAIELGYTHIDTAEMYGGGHAEELIAQAIRPFPRTDLFIASKVWKASLEAEDTTQALERSLRRLDTDYLDLYMLHRPNQDIPLEEAFKALNLALRQGKVRHLGVSNFSLEQIKMAQSLAETPLAAVQAPYNLHQRKYQVNGVIKYCQEQGIAVVAYSPLERGYLCEDTVLQELARKYGATPAQLALYWVIQQPMLFALPMSMRKEHLVENLGALDLSLDPANLAALDDIELPDDHLWPT